MGVFSEIAQAPANHTSVIYAHRSVRDDEFLIDAYYAAETFAGRASTRSRPSISSSGSAISIIQEFIKYLEDEIKLQEEINDKLLATAFEEILQKYKSIIGVSDESR